MVVLKLLVTAAALGPLLAIGVADLSGIEHRWFDLAAQFSAPAAVGALVPTVLFALLRWRISILMGAITTAVCLIAAAPQAFVRMPPADEGVPTVRLYSANLWAGNDQVEAIRDSVARAGPDVVILIEASDAAYGALDLIVPDLPYRTASPRVPWGGGGARTVIASRWPVSEAVEEPGVHAQTTVVRSPMGALRVTGVHLTRPWPYQIEWEQVRQIEALGVAVADQPKTSLIVAGDFNSVTDGRIGRLFARDGGLVPAPAFPGTWPAQAPSAFSMGIDNVWISRDLTVIERRLGDRNGSDHRPVVSVIGRARP